jgi:sugar/nucleoside kinase (ribokinase family)
MKAPFGPVGVRAGRYLGIAPVDIVVVCGSRRSVCGSQNPADGRRRAFSGQCGFSGHFSQIGSWEIGTLSLECLSVGILVVDHLCDPLPRLPAQGELLLVDRLPLSVGGCASNAAIDLARLGVKVGVVGCVGRDAFGEYMIGQLQAAGANTQDVVIENDAETSGSLVINVAGEDRRFIHAVGANARLRAEHISRERVRSAKVFYVGGYLLLAGLEPEGLAEIFREARSHGVITVLDVVSPKPIDSWAKLAPVLPETDVFLPNQDEAVVITGETDPLRQAERFRSAGARTVVITCGADGSLLLSDQLRLRAGVYPVEYRGGTGSGDAFDAGYIAGLLAGEDPAGCLRWGSAVGASCVRSISATDSVFTRDEALEFMRKHSLKINAF